jgi:Acetyltransferase (GNAT) family
MSNDFQVSKLQSADELSDLPPGLSIFDPLLRHEVKEALESGGEAFVSRDSTGSNNGLFIYDDHEATGTIFTKSREVFDRFFRLKPSSYIFSELEVAEIPREIWNVWQLDVDKTPVGHRFKHRVSIDANAEEIERFMAIAQPETNRKWVGVALKNGDKCFVVKIADRIVGIALMTIVDGVARSHGLYVVPHLRRKGMMRDNFEARLIYLKSRRVHTLINEIAESNVASSALAANEGERIVGRIFLYTSPDPDAPPQAQH